MKLFKNIVVVGLALLGSSQLMTSCSEDFLETTSSVDVSDVFILSSLDNMYLAVNGILAEMVSQSSGSQALGGLPAFGVYTDIMGDDIIWQSSTTYKSTALSWTSHIDETSFYPGAFWSLYYQWILNANQILEGLESVEVTDQDLFNQVKGECLAIRGWAHFCLVQLFADRYDATISDNSQEGIIYRTSSIACEQARATVEECYTYIKADLDESVVLLDGLDILVSHYSEKVVWGLKARVAMAMQDYTNAATYAKNAIDTAEAEGLALMEGDELYCGFADITTDTDEAMYSDITPDEATVYYYSFYAYMSWNYYSTAIRSGVKAINADTYDTMSETDLRRAWWDPTGEAEVPSTSYNKIAYQNRKFEARSTGSAVGNVAFMRLAEMYLTYAEALCRGGKDADAQTAFTAFQVTRDPSYVSQGNTGDALSEEIMNSRRVELWGEGFRFQDLKRINNGLERGRNFDVAFCTFRTKDADIPEWTWQIPDDETYYNTLCTKNYY